MKKTLCASCRSAVEYVGLGYEPWYCQNCGWLRTRDTITLTTKEAASLMPKYECPNCDYKVITYAEMASPAQLRAKEAHQRNCPAKAKA